MTELIIYLISVVICGFGVRATFLKAVNAPCFEQGALWVVVCIIFIAFMLIPGLNTLMVFVLFAMWAGLLL